MAYAQQQLSPIAAFGQALARALSAVVAATDSIVEDRRNAAAALEAKTDAELARLGLERAQIAQDVHRHLYYS